MSATPAAEALPANKWRTHRRLLGAVLLCVILLIVYKGVQIGRQGWAAYQAAQALRSLAATGLRVDELPRLQPTLQTFATALTNLESEVRPLRPLLHGLRAAPKYGPTLAAAPELLVAGKEFANLANETLTLFKPVVQGPLPSDKQALISAVLSTTASISQTQLAALALHVETAQQALAQVNHTQLPSSLAQRLDQVTPFLPLLDSGLRLGNILPTLLGMNGAKTYLILVQNNQELRATGGFISAIGKLTLDKAQVRSLDFTDSYNIFRKDVDHPPAPMPMQQFMGIQILLARDANWSPDLPTTARLLKALYALDTGTKVDGIVTIDLHAVELLLNALGPLQAPGAAEPLTGANIIDQVKQLWDKPTTGDTLQKAGFTGWWGQRKDFIPALAKLILQRVQSGQVNYLQIVRAAQQALDERAIQLWVDEPATAEQLATLNWDGALHPRTDADFLALVDTNMGYNKVNAVLQRSLTYSVTWPAQGTQPALATVAISYTNPVTQTDPVCEAKPYYGATYDDMIRRCYFGYVRLYVPGESQLLSITGVESDSISSQRGERGLRVLAGYFVLKPGEQTTITFRYQLPARLKPNTYALVLQRQSGAPPLPLTLHIGEQTVATTVMAGKLEWRP